MPLLRISDLNEPQNLGEGLAIAENLGKQFGAFMNARHRGFAYTVQVHGEKTRAPGIHASELSGCERRAVYSMLGTDHRSGPTEGVIKWNMRFHAGHAFHALIQNGFQRMAEASGGQLSVQEEVRISPAISAVAKEWSIHSSCDLVVVVRSLWETGATLRIAVEIKTASPQEFAKLTAPKPEHLDQLTIYQKCLDIPLGWILYINKGNQNYTPASPPFVVPFDKARWVDLENKMFSVHDHVANGTLPLRTESIACEFCAYAWTCQPKILKTASATRHGVLRKPGKK